MTVPSRTAEPSARSGPPWGIMILIGLCVLIEVILTLGDLGWLSVVRLRATAYEYAGFWPGLLGSWTPNYLLQPYTMFASYAFFHSGLIHLIINMLTLYSLGTAVQARVKARGFFVVYGAAILGGALAFGFLADTLRPMVGASGGLFGLAGALLAWNYVDRFSASERLWPVARAAVLLLLLNLVMWWVMDGLLAWQTHLGGFMAGWVAALLVDPRSQVDDLPSDQP